MGKVLGKVPDTFCAGSVAGLPAPSAFGTFLAMLRAADRVV